MNKHRLSCFIKVLPQWNPSLRAPGTHRIVILFQIPQVSLQHVVSSGGHDKAAEPGTWPRTPKLSSEAGVWGCESLFHTWLTDVTCFLELQNALCSQDKWLLSWAYNRDFLFSSDSSKLRLSEGKLGHPPCVTTAPAHSPFSRQTWTSTRDRPGLLLREVGVRGIKFAAGVAGFSLRRSNWDPLSW